MFPTALIIAFVGLLTTIAFAYSARPKSEPVGICSSEVASSSK